MTDESTRDVLIKLEQVYQDQLSQLDDTKLKLQDVHNDILQKTEKAFKAFKELATMKEQLLLSIVSQQEKRIKELVTLTEQQETKLKNAVHQVRRPEYNPDPFPVRICNDPGFYAKESGMAQPAIITELD